MAIVVERETDVARLQQMVALVQYENEQLHKRLRKIVDDNDESYQLEIKAIREKLERFQRKLYGHSSERRGHQGGDQGSNGEQDKKPRTGHGPSKQPALPIVEAEVYDLEGSDRNCPQCGLEMNEMAGQAETCEEIDVVQREFRLVRITRKKYRCRCGNHIETAPGPARLIPGGRYSIDFAAMVACDKYLDHLPLARQERAMRRQGLEVTRQALWDQIAALAAHLEPTYEAIGRKVLAEPVIGADETTWPLLEKGGSKSWWAWAVTSSDAVYYRIAPSRSAQVAAEVLGDFEGTVVCDGYGVYPAVLRRLANERAGPPRIRLANCWSHVRRKFIEAEPNYPEAGEALELIDRLFAIERRAAEATDIVEARRELRRAESRMVIDEIHGWMLGQRSLAKTGIGRAISYTDKLWKGLVVFLEDPVVPLHNNASEREMRALALGRVNHYGSRSLRGTKVAAAFYTLLETAKLSGLEPTLYLSMAAKRAILVPGTITLPQDILAAG